MSRTSCSHRWLFVLVSTFSIAFWFHSFRSRGNNSNSLEVRRTAANSIEFNWSSDYEIRVTQNKVAGLKKNPSDSEGVPSNQCPPFSRNAGFAENIFFIETADDMSGCLTPRSVCGIESTARANPDMKIHVYIDTEIRPVASAKKSSSRPKPGQVASCSVTKTLDQLSNVQIWRSNLRHILNESARWAVLEKEIFMENATEWTELHLKDALKLILLRKYGGIYLDMNIVNYRPIHCLQNATVYFDKFKHLANEILAFDQTHPFPGFAVRYAATKYDPNLRQTFGSDRIREAFDLFCNVTANSDLKIGTYRCHRDHSISVSHWRPFFPIERHHTMRYFDPALDEDEDVVRSFRERSYLAYVDAAGWGLSVPPTSTYGILARRFCPTTWEAAALSNPRVHF